MTQVKRRLIIRSLYSYSLLVQFTNDTGQAATNHSLAVFVLTTCPVRVMRGHFCHSTSEKLTHICKICPVTLVTTQPTTSGVMHLVMRRLFSCLNNARRTSQNRSICSEVACINQEFHKSVLPDKHVSNQTQTGRSVARLLGTIRRHAMRAILVNNPVVDTPH